MKNFPDRIAIGISCRANLHHILTGATRKLVVKRKPRNERGEFLLRAPWTISESAKILYRPPDIDARFFKLRRRLVISIAL